MQEIFYRCWLRSRVEREIDQVGKFQGSELEERFHSGRPAGSTFALCNSCNFHSEGLSALLNTCNTSNNPQLHPRSIVSEYLSRSKTKYLITWLLYLGNGAKKSGD
jgi:hypothetical protein